LELSNKGTPNEWICSTFVKRSDSSGVKSLFICLDYRSIQYIGGEFLDGETDRLCSTREPAVHNWARARTAATACVDLCGSGVVEIVHDKDMVRARINYIQS
jgi:hypothetical protein